ncbi:TetR/AcrR family transcriptional regulator [Salininema proteolyticum]|uniref:TetR/AcrR family transcriptional regulator n=1 Tax=Salininema proteolyticum TaxID=1607685 RepID=A0ABV8TZD1_9ACTN
MTKPGSCAVCGTALPAAATGRPRRYCSRACQARAYRRRKSESAVAPVAAPPGRLTEVAVVRAAIEIANSEGLAGLTMRGLATALGTATAGLYRRFPNRNALLAAMAEYELGAVAWPDRRETWSEDLEAVAWTEWRLYRRRPWVLAILARMRPPFSPALVDLMDRYHRSIARVPGEPDFLPTFLAVTGLVQGLALLPVSESPSAEDLPESELESIVGILADHRAPDVARALLHQSPAVYGDLDSIVLHSLRTLIAGLERTGSAGPA